ncbi:hypothetical protein C8P63_13915 [Melghirimyces profundicolus]|uniref:Integrase-like protein n=1 Tax=Melghirimyces profundicolus TaxID=1242148 RepID=A0A2T6B179_9BACL|nr:hypothetical protein [Melghirimyces profundicolus]PTX49820.1 hypothetical protein C8P63_13915 [Melghirimyces profundicolus]
MKNFLSIAPNQESVTDHSRERSMALPFRHYGLFNNEIVAFQISTRNDNARVLQTVEQAIQKRKDVSGTILHSDRGFQSHPVRTKT